MVGISGGWVTGSGMRQWCLIETGGNQAYIFGTNRLRHVVGASYLVHQAGTAWVPEAAARCGARVVLAISGKALLLVDDPAAGRAVISEVSLRALREAPGMEITGVVGPGFAPALRWAPGLRSSAEGHPLTHVEALTQAYEQLETARASRPSPLLRDPLIPWYEVCRDSGLPAAGLEQHPDSRQVSAPVLAKSKARGPARQRMRDLLCDLPDVVPADLDDLREDGWLAVIHADGNGVGKVFTQFAELALNTVGPAAAGVPAGAGIPPGEPPASLGETETPTPVVLPLEQHADLLTRFTSELECATETALGLAVRDATDGQHADGTVLPVVVGGDDVTIVCHARFALPLVRAFAAAFEEQTAAQPTVRAMTGGGLTAAAGIAFIKPHHPFAAAYGLAEELCASAKSVNQPDGSPVSSVDLHVAFESTLTDLAGLRERLTTGGIARYGGPYVITAQDNSPARSRDIAGLERAMRTVSALSSSMAHYLREGLAIGPEEYRRRANRIARSADLPSSVRPDDLDALVHTPAVSSDGQVNRCGENGETVVRLLDALLLAAIARPSTAAGVSATRVAVPGVETAAVLAAESTR